MKGEGPFPPEIQFRAARPEDVDAVVPLIYSSGPAAFDYVFDQGQPGGAPAFLRHAYCRGDGEFGFRNHEVAVSAGSVVAAGAAFDSRRVLAFTVAGALQILSYFGPLRAWPVIVRGLRTETIIRPPRSGEYYLCHLGVSPELRSRGLGASLVAHLLGRAGRPLHRVATLDVAVTNPRAQALYARLGFVVTTARPSSLVSRYGAVPGHHRMGLPIR